MPRPQIFVDPWKKWARDPVAIPLLVQLTNVYAMTNTSLNVTLAGVTITADGVDCSSTTNSPLTSVDMKVRKEYRLMAIGTNTDYGQITLKVNPSWTPLSTAGKTAVPKQYVLLVNGTPPEGVLTETTLYLDQTGCGFASNSWLIEVTDQKPYHYYADDGSDDPTPAAGDGTFMSIGAAKNIQTNKIALDWSVSLGRLFDGTAAGRLRIRESGLSPEIYTPTNIYYTSVSDVERSQIELITSSYDGVLRQVKAWQSFVDIVSTQATKTELKFYHSNQLLSTNKNASGYYTNLSGSPFVVWTVLNPEPTTTNKLYIIEARNGLSSTNSLVFNPASTSETWTLQYGTNNEQRVETRGVTFTYSPTLTNRIETVAIRYASSNSPAYKCTETYSLFNWGWELTQTSLDPDNNNLLTTYDYYTDLGDPLNYGKPSVFRYPDGYWETRLYEHEDTWHLGTLQWVLRPSTNTLTTADTADTSNCYAVNYKYSDAFGTVTEMIHYYDGYAQPFREDLIDAYPMSPFIQSEERRFIAEDLTSSLGKYALIADDSNMNGLAGHPWNFQDAHSAQMVMYYHGGTYNPSTRTFTTNSTIVGDGPDWRQSVIYFGRAEHYEPGEEGLVTVPKVEGQDLYDEDAFLNRIQLGTNRSYRIARIVHDGSLAQSERGVFTGLNANGDGSFEVYATYVYQNDTLGHCTNITVYNCSSPTSARTIYQADYCGAAANDGELLLWSMDETGARTEYQYDSLKRVAVAAKKGVSAGGGFASQADVLITFRYDPTGKRLSQVVSSSGLGLTNTWAYDVAGRQISATDEKGLLTATSYSSGGQVTTITMPSGATDIRSSLADRRLATRTGTGVVQENHDYWLADPEPAKRVRLMEKITYGGSSTRWKTIGTDWLGLPVRTETPDFGGSGSVVEYSKYAYNLDTPWITTKSGQPERDNYLDFDGTVGKTILQDGRTGDSLASQSRITRTLKQFAKSGSDWFRYKTNYTYLVDNDPTPTITSVSKQRLSGFTSTSIESEITTWDADSNATVVTTYIDRSTKKVTVVTDPSQSALNATNITINGLLQLESTATVAAPTRHYYDALGRETSITSPLGFTSTTTYNQNNQVASKSDFTGATMSYTYYANGATGAGQVQSETRSDGKKTYHSYTLRGELYRTWGDVPYPEERVYSAFGELVELHTFQNGSAWNQATWPGSTGTSNLTLWTYDPYSGQLAVKTDAANRSVSYTYTNGLLVTRTWARGVTVTNTYDTFAALVSQDYSDATVPVQINNYSRAGLPREIIDATGTNEFTYDWANRLATAYCSNGLMTGITVSNHFNALAQRDVLNVLSPSTTISAAQYGYDTCGRLGTVSSGIYSATYGYAPNSDLLRTTTCKSNSTAVLTTTKSWDYGMRLAAIVNSANGVVVSSHGYQYDTVNRRTRAFLEDGSTWVYGYNDRDELSGANRYWNDWNPVAGQQFGYNYDNIGNRKTASYGGDTNGATMRTNSYTVNSLNEYTGIVNPGYQEICGAAVATNSVTVNGGTADRTGEYFHREITVSNGSGPLWQSVSISSGTTTTNGGLVCSGNNQTLTYDADGNLTFDGTWTYEWDGENRLVLMTMTNGVANMPDAKRLRLEFAYDSQNRRTQKVVRHWNSGSWVLDSDSRFVYDGWNLLVVLDASLTVQSLFTWGQDLSGTMTKGGGIGGLILVTSRGASLTNCFAVFDGNGNVTRLTDAASGAVSARYEYSAFGESLRATGPMAKSNPFRFSTKVTDDEMGLVYYGFRYYSPSTGRWIGRDPSADQNRAMQLYLFGLNRPLDTIDPDGRSPFIDLLMSGIANVMMTLREAQAMLIARGIIFNRLSEIAQFAFVVGPYYGYQAASYAYMAAYNFMATSPRALQLLDATIEGVASYSGPVYDAANLYKSIVSAANTAFEAGLVTLTAGSSLNPVVDDAVAEPQ